ncbi:MAG: baseplate J/gp47 family protein, partial [Methyloprofundus sp.]|nr:baseplate J/gp47 family protein [Methyloprofundus sp.]
QVAMVYHLLEDKAEAVTVAAVDKEDGQITLLPSLKFTWKTWPKSESILNVVPRWKRQCWLNGRHVIRTKEPHGLSAESYISWKIDNAYVSWKVNQEWGEYELRLRKVNNLDELDITGRFLLTLALLGFPENPQLHFRIFDGDGIKADITESALLNGEAVTTLKQRLSSLPDRADLSPEVTRETFINAMLCFQKWRYAKIIETDKWDLRLEVSGPLPQEGVDIYELRPIEGSIFPANYDAVVLLGGGNAPVSVASVPLEFPEPEEEPLFCLRKVIPAELKNAAGETATGGGLLPPASLPEIGCFLFPSPMLPLDLVKAAVELMLSIGVMAIPSTGEIVIKGMPFGGLLEGAEDPADAASKLFDMLNGLEGIVQDHDSNCKPLWLTADEVETTVPTDKPKLVGSNEDPEKLVTWRDNLDPDDVDDAAVIKELLTEKLSVPEGKEATILFQKLTEDIVEKGALLAIPKEPMIKAVVQASDPLYMFDGSSEIGAGDWVVGKFSDELKAVKVSTVNWFTDNDRTETFSLSFEGLDGHPELQKVYANFRAEIITTGATVNNTPVDPDKLDLENVPESLKIGQAVLLTAEGKAPVAATIKSINGNTIITAPSADGFTKGELIILGNVVLAGHGESKPAKILGSGDAAKSNQAFTLEVNGISFPPDTTKTSGVAAAIDVEVAGRIWEQVSSLKNSASGDHHYSIRMTEDGYVKVIFGDGEYGRRLPTGKNNIRVRYRLGSGLSGNVAAGGLEKPVNPHPLIKAIKQPLRAEGGGDMEDVTSLRENAPPTLLALERAVSLADFAHLAASLSSVWQAKAYSEFVDDNKMDGVRVVIVPAGGGTSTDVENDVEAFLQQHALPGIQVTVEDCFRKRIGLTITIRVKSDQFALDNVKSRVRHALLNHFTLQNRKLGEHLYLSEVYKIVEGIQGVENSLCVLNNDDALQLVRATSASMVVYLDTNLGSILDVTHEEYPL